MDCGWGTLPPSAISLGAGTLPPSANISRGLDKPLVTGSNPTTVSSVVGLGVAITLLSTLSQTVQHRKVSF